MLAQGQGQGQGQGNAADTGARAKLGQLMEAALLNVK